MASKTKKSDCVWQEELRYHVMPAGNSRGEAAIPVGNPEDPTWDFQQQ